MPSLREIRRKIKSVKSTQQITKAMKMVAAARMRRAQSAILASRPFAVHMEDAVRDLASLEAADRHAAPMHPFFERRAAGGACLVLVTADKGLCGAFNSNVLRAGVEWLRRHKDRKVSVAIVGRKARDVMHRLKEVPFDISIELVGIFPKVGFAHAELLGKAVSKAYLEDGCATVDAIYNEFKSVAAQKVVAARLLPIEAPATAEGANPQGFKFEPGREALLSALLPRYLKAQLYRILLESQAAELAARMNAMDSASKNAGELIGAMTLRLNRTRQGIITGEIAELVGGAEALAS